MLFTYLFISFFLTVMLHSFFNLSKLSFRTNATHVGYVNSDISITINIKTDKSHFDLHLTLQGDLCKEISYKPLHIKQVHKGDTTEFLNVAIHKRGVHKIGRVKVLSEFSYGLFRTWTLLDFNHQLFIYPQPRKITHHQNNAKTDKEHLTDGVQSAQGSDDFNQLSPYIVGESIARIAWKQLAKGQGKLSKQYQESKGQDTWLKLSNMPSESIEMQLSYLCYLVNNYSDKKQVFGLDLSTQIKHQSSTLTELHLQENRQLLIEPSSGSEHQKACLTALALY